MGDRVSKRRWISAAAVVVLLGSAVPASAEVGDVDPGYGVGGSHEIPQTGGPHWIGAMAVRPTGEAILTGSSIGAGSGEQSFWVTEVAADGLSRDDSTDIGLSANHEFGTAISLRPDGRFHVAGERGDVGGVDTDMFVASFDAGGDLMPAFGVDGVALLGALGTERTSSVFTDGDDVVVGGWREAAGFPGLVTRLQPSGLPDPTFGSGGTAELTWTGYLFYDTIETTVWPTSGAGYLAVGMFSSGEDAGVATMVVSDSGLGTAPTEVLAGAIESHDTIPLGDGTVAIATQLFSEVEGSVLVVTKVGADGAVIWQTPGHAVGGFGAGVVVAELRDGSLAVAVNRDDFTQRVYRFAPDGSMLGAIVGEVVGNALARAGGVAAGDGGLYLVSVTNPTDGGSISGELAVTKYLGDESGRFLDDDGSVHEADIEAIAADGITKGCNPPVNDRFCPAEPVTRGQMAAFLVRALGLTDDGGGNLFVDDDASVFESDIDRLKTAGITKGCNPPVNDRFCPAEPVTRGQMASFLARALGLGS